MRIGVYVYAVLADAGVDTSKPSMDKLLQVILGQAPETVDDVPVRPPPPPIGSSSNSDQSAQNTTPDPFVEPSVIVVVKPADEEDDTLENLEVALDSYSDMILFRSTFIFTYHSCLKFETNKNRYITS